MACSTHLPVLSLSTLIKETFKSSRHSEISVDELKQYVFSGQVYRTHSMDPRYACLPPNEVSMSNACL